MKSVELYNVILSCTKATKDIVENKTEITLTSEIYSNTYLLVILGMLNIYKVPIIVEYHLNDRIKSIKVN